MRRSKCESDYASATKWGRAKIFRAFSAIYLDYRSGWPIFAIVKPSTIYLLWLLRYIMAEIEWRGSKSL